MSKPPIPPGARVVCYERTSKEESEPERQSQANDAWARAHRTAILHRYLDEGGRRHDALDPRKRPDFARLLAAVGRGEVDVCLVEELTRLGFRDKYQFMHFAYHFREHGVLLIESRTGRVLNGEEDSDFIISGVGAIGSRREVTNLASRSLGRHVLDAQAGLWWGGFVPYGLCVVCLDAHGRERWRVEDVGFQRRLLLFPDGRQERRDGKGGFPQDRSPGDRLVLRPSGFAERLEVVARIFEWADQESIACYAMARRLNEQRAPHPRGLWHGIRVRGMLANPAYIGRPAVLKHTSARYASYDEGRVVEVNGDGRWRRRPKSDWVMPAAPIYEPLVAPERFERVQQKLDGPKKTRAPVSPELWLSGLVYCCTGGCGKAMAGWSRPWKPSRPHCYVCKGYRAVGGQFSPCGTGHKETDHALLVRVLDAWLQETGQLARTLAKSDGAGELLRPMFDAKHALHERLLELRRRMELALLEELSEVFEYEELPGGRRRFAIPRANEPDTVLELPGTADWASVQEVFAALEGTHARRARRERAELEETLRKLTLSWSDLPTARTRAVAGSEMKRIEQRLEHLDEGPGLAAQARELSAELLRLVVRIDKARKELKGGTRRRRAAVEELLERINVYHVHEPRTKGSKQVYARLDRVEIVPWTGEARTYEVRHAGKAGPSPSSASIPSLASLLLARSYGREELERLRRAG